ncbi:MAG: CPBP family glutamic-type intramembrane protease [Phycisphaerales bacterium]
MSEPTTTGAEPGTPRFCGACGTPLDTGLCPACLPAPSGGELEERVGRARRSVSAGRLFNRALMTYVLFLLVSMAAVIGVTAFAEDDGLPIVAWIEILAMGLQAAIAVLMLCLTWPQVRASFTTLPRWTWFAGAAAGGLGTFVLATLLILPWQWALGAEELRYSDPFLAAGMGWAVVVASIAIHPAIVEEAAFRGIIQGSLQSLLRPWEAIVVGAVLFAILHLSPAAFPHLLIMGLALGWARERCGSIYPGVVLHAVHNGLCIADEAFGFGV